MNRFRELEKLKKFTVFVFKRENDSFDVLAESEEEAEKIAEEELAPGWEIESIGKAAK
jgi:hypothetical protein